ncbi:hypothetical protein LJ759_13785 [Arthrobacter sp. zg-Y1110]|nr:hypothetical protein [Arthrobacter sp. zg-Y1110]MCC3292028.1 hypothetical protein [Arthrobacter sp. zg-Y1110]UWX86697.1 hypothetical protein N2K99_04700 [Arthrobacter sp. zg-Y1110]
MEVCAQAVGYGVQHGSFPGAGLTEDDGSGSAGSKCRTQIVKKLSSPDQPGDK